MANIVNKSKNSILKIPSFYVKLLVEVIESENLPQGVADPPEFMVEANHSEEWDVPNGTSLFCEAKLESPKAKSRAVSCQTRIIEEAYSFE